MYDILELDSITDPWREVSVVSVEEDMVSVVIHSENSVLSFTQKPH